MISFPRCQRLDDAPPSDLSAFVDGELRGRRRRRVARHLRACPACRLVVEQLRRVRALTAELTAEDSGEVAPAPVPSSRSRPWWRRGRWSRE